MPAREKQTASDEVIVRIEGTTPDKADTASVLRLAASYFELVAALADDEGTKVQFTGIRIGKGSVVVAAHASAPEAARATASRAARCISGEDQPPHGARVATNSARDALRRLPTNQRATVIVGPWKTPLTTIVAPSNEPASATLAVRAKLIRVGGQQPAARFESRAEDRPFTLDLEVNLAKKIGQFLYSELDIVARVHRDRDGVIEYGQLTEFVPVAEDDATSGWKDWYRSHAADWDGARDIEVELGRVRR